MKIGVIFNIWDSEPEVYFIHHGVDFIVFVIYCAQDVILYSFIIVYKSFSTTCNMYCIL